MNRTGHSAIPTVGVERLSDLQFSSQSTEAAAAAGRNPESPKKRSTFCLDKSSLQLINALGVDGRKSGDQKPSAPKSMKCVTSEMLPPSLETVKLLDFIKSEKFGRPF